MKILARGRNADKAAQITALLTLGLWDTLSMEDREAWCERAEVLDTPGGRILFQTLRQLRIFDTTQVTEHRNK